MNRVTTIAVAIVAGIAVALVVRSELLARDRESAILDAIEEVFSHGQGVPDPARGGGSDLM